MGALLDDDDINNMTHDVSLTNRRQAYDLGLLTGGAYDVGCFDRVY